MLDVRQIVVALRKLKSFIREGHEEELDIAMVPFKMMVYVENKAEYLPADETEQTDKVLNLSITDAVNKLVRDLEAGAWSPVKQ